MLEQHAVGVFGGEKGKQVAHKGHALEHGSLGLGEDLQHGLCATRVVSGALIVLFVEHRVPQMRQVLQEAAHVAPAEAQPRQVLACALCRDLEPLCKALQVFLGEVLFF